MTHIQSIFDLCADIQERIGNELAPLVKSKKLKKNSIHECKKWMKKYEVLKLEDHYFKHGRKNTGRMILHLFKMTIGSENYLRDRVFSRYYTLEQLEEYDALNTLVPDLTLRRLYIIQILIGFSDQIQKGEELNIHGLKWKTYLKDGKFVSRCIRDSWSFPHPVIKSYTSKQLDEIAEPLGIKKWRKYWKKKEKIHYLMKTEV